MTGEPSLVSIVGLPGSGKTTLLAALWHMVRERGAVTRLTFDSLKQGNYDHLNNLAKRWRAGEIQQRTQTSGMRTVGMRLRDDAGKVTEVVFPDVPGEEFSRMWEKRELDEAMVGTLRASALVLLINGDKVQFPAWVVERVAVARGARLPEDNAEIVDWRADLAPTQVQLVELLQFLMSDELMVGPRRLAILVSVWDKAEGEGLLPVDFLAAKFPLLFQYLRSGRDPWTWKVWGLSAQGCDYEDPEKNETRSETQAILQLDRPSDRIKVIDGAQVSSDITAPIDWLIR